MKRIILAMSLLMGITTTAWADAFQFIVSQTGSPMVGAAVYFGEDLVGYTDVMGIIIIGNPKGLNRFSMVYRGEKRKLQINIADNDKLQEIRVELNSYNNLLDEFIIEQDHVKKLKIDNSDLYLLVDNIHRKDRTNIIIFKKNHYEIKEGKNDYSLEVRNINELGKIIKKDDVLEGDEVKFFYNGKKYKLEIINVMFRKMSLFTDHMKFQLFEIP